MNSANVMKFALFLTSTTIATWYMVHKTLCHWLIPCCWQTLAAWLAGCAKEHFMKGCTVCISHTENESMLYTYKVWELMKDNTKLDKVCLYEYTTKIKKITFSDFKNLKWITDLWKWKINHKMFELCFKRSRNVAHVLSNLSNSCWFSFIWTIVTTKWLE